MDKETLIERLNKAGKSATEFAKDFVFNKLSDNLVFTIQPNVIETSEHLDDLERANLINRIKELNKIFTVNEIAGRLLVENRIPIWINCSVIRASRKKTTIQLLTSRRFRNDKDLYHQNDKFPPFHINIQNPPYQQIDNDEKFNVNWRFDKIQTAYKLWKSKKKLNKEIIEIRGEGKDYWFVFDRLCENLKKRQKNKIVEELSFAKGLLNGLTDGWHDYNNELNKVFSDNKSNLTEKEITDYEYLIFEMRKKLNK